MNLIHYADLIVELVISAVESLLYMLTFLLFCTMIVNHVPHSGRKYCSSL
jgi:hypothetical protein